MSIIQGSQIIFTSFIFDSSHIAPNRFSGCVYSPSWWHEHLPGGVALNERVQNLSCEPRAYLLSDEMLPVEFKSVRASSNKEVGGYPWWLEQFQSYLKLFGSNTGLLYVLHLMGSWKPPTEPHLRAYKLWFTDKEISDNWHEMLRRKDLLLEALRNNNPPDKTKFEWACKACSAKEICNGGEK